MSQIMLEEIKKWLKGSSLSYVNFPCTGAQHIFLKQISNFICLKPDSFVKQREELLGPPQVCIFTPSLEADTREALALQSSQSFQYREESQKTGLVYPCPRNTDSFDYCFCLPTFTKITKPFYRQSLAALFSTTEARDFQVWDSLVVIQILYKLNTHLDPALHPQGTGNEEVTRRSRSCFLDCVSESLIALLRLLSSPP